MTRICYLARPIDGAGEDPRPEQWADEAIFSLTNRGWVVFDPARAFTVSVICEPDRRVQAINNWALGRADAVLALLPPGVPSIGVPLEIERARGSKPVAVVGAERSWALAECYGITHFERIEEAAAWLDEQPPRTGPALQPMLVAGEGEMPVRHYDGDAGFDLFVSQDVTVPAHSFVDVSCGISVQLPDHCWAMITGRSSTLRKRGLLVAQGIIDSGYRGELFAGVWNLTGANVRVSKGERLAQLIPFGLTSRTLAPVRVEKLDPSDRGEAGFGSSGA